MLDYEIFDETMTIHVPKGDFRVQNSSIRETIEDVRGEPIK